MSTKIKVIGECLFGKVRRNLLALFLLNPGRSYYLLELVRLLDTGRGGVQRELSNLLNAGLIRRKKSGTKVYFTSADSSETAQALTVLLRYLISPRELLAKATKNRKGIKTAVRSAITVKEERKQLSYLACGEFKEDELRSEIEKIELLTGSTIGCFCFCGGNIPAKVSAEGERLEWIQSESSVFLKGKLASLVTTEVAEEPAEYDLFSQAGIDWGK